MDEKTICVAILAAGKASRMGRSKLTMPFSDATLLDRAIGAAKGSGTDRVVVITGAHREEVEGIVRGYESVSIAYNPLWEKGQSTSVKESVRFCQDQGCSSLLLMVADQPAITAQVLRVLINASQHSTHQAYVSCNGERDGSPCLFKTECFDDLSSLKGDQGARGVYRSWIPEQVCYVDFDDPDFFADIDTLEDAAAFEQCSEVE